MSSQSVAHFLINPSLKAPKTPAFASTQKYAAGVSPLKLKEKWVNGKLSLKCNAIHNPRAQGMVEIVQDEEEKELVKVDRSVVEIKKHVDTVRSMLNSMGDGEISTSAYDVAWVAMVKNVNGSNIPQFPSCLEWIINNQMKDGSWGDIYFSTYDRILNTLACIVALKTWNASPEIFEKGLSFIRENMCRLEEEKAEHMPIGYEIVFPTLLEKAADMGIQVPNDTPAIKQIYDHRDLKLNKIPREVLYSVPTGLLYSLEGLQDLDWPRLLKLQFEDGSFFWCPSSTAYAFMQTNDDKCLNFLNHVVTQFNGAVPNIYPVDTFEHIWSLDRLQRLGISRYFDPEFKERVAYIYRYWNEKGLGSGRNAPVPDVDDTAMGFRLLRLNGYDVSPDVFKQFEKGADEFVCMAGQSSQAVTGLFNLLRAAQCLHPGEKIFEKAKKFCSKFLKEKRACNQLYDKWIVSKDLPGEVGYALDVPWYASLPRLEARFYVEHYGGGDDVWIGKVLYRMYYVNSDTYLELAKMDFNRCQELQQLEWDRIQKWWKNSHLEEFGISRETLLKAYFLASASIFEPERSVERMAWAKSAVLVEAVAFYFSKETSIKKRRAFLLEFGYGASGGRYKKINGSSSNVSKTGVVLIGLLLSTLDQISLDAQESHDRDIRQLLHHSWEMWLTKNSMEEDEYQGEAELLVNVINLCSGRPISEEDLSHPHYKHLAHLTNSISHQLSPFYRHKEHNGNYDPENDTTVSCVVEPDMQELVQLVFQNSSEDIDPEVNRTFLTVAKSLYYAAYCDPTTIDSHIAKVLFERVV